MRAYLQVLQVTHVDGYEYMMKCHFSIKYGYIEAENILKLIIIVIKEDVAPCQSFDVLYHSKRPFLNARCVYLQKYMLYKKKSSSDKLIIQFRRSCSLFPLFSAFVFIYLCVVGGRF